MANAFRSGGANNLCEVIDNHANILDSSLTDAEILSQGELTLTKYDGTTTVNSIPWFANLVKTGLGVSQQSTPTQTTFDYTAGSYQINATSYSIGAAGTVTVDNGDATYNRFDIIYVDTSSTVKVKKGTASATPSPPSLITSELPLLTVLVGEGATPTGGTVSIYSSNIIDGTIVGNTLVWDGTNWIENGNVWIDTSDGAIRLNNSTNTASGVNSLAAGTDTVASGDYSATFGTENIASGDYSFCWGEVCKATGQTATAWGDATQAFGQGSTAFGQGADAVGFFSTAWGQQTEAVGEHTTAWGSLSVASGETSTAWGRANLAEGGRSTAWGLDNTAFSYVETVMGSYATEYTATSRTQVNTADRVLTIGNGENVSERSDTTRIWKSGYHEFNGSINIGETTGGTGSSPVVGDMRYTGGQYQAYTSTGWQSFVGNKSVGVMYFSGTNATATSIPVVDTFYKISGTTIENTVNNDFAHTNNRLTYTGDTTQLFTVNLTLSATAGNNQDIEFGIYDSNLGGVAEQSKIFITTDGSGNGANIATQYILEMNNNDYVEAHCGNLSSTTDITVERMTVSVTPI